MFKVIAAGIVGIGLGVVLAAWAETLDPITATDSTDLGLDDLDDILEDDTTVTEEEKDETLE